MIAVYEIESKFNNKRLWFKLMLIITFAFIFTIINISFLYLPASLYNTIDISNLKIYLYFVLEILLVSVEIWFFSNLLLWIFSLGASDIYQELFYQNYFLILNNKFTLIYSNDHKEIFVKTKLNNSFLLVHFDNKELLKIDFGGEQIITKSNEQENLSGKSLLDINIDPQSFEQNFTYSEANEYGKELLKKAEQFSTSAGIILLGDLDEMIIFTGKQPEFIHYIRMNQLSSLLKKLEKN